MPSLLCMFLAFFFCSAPTWAHRINLFAYVEGGQIVGEVYFADGSPTKGAQVELLSPAGQPLAEAKTNAEGRFTLPLPDLPEVKIVAQAQMGHRAEMTLRLGQGAAPRAPLAQGPTAKSDSPPEDLARLVREEVRREVLPLRTLLEEILKELRQPGLKDIFAGLGYILGLSGWFLWFKSRRS